MLIPRLFIRPARPLPDASHIELVSILISGRIPIFVMGLTVAFVAIFTYWTHPGPYAPPLAALTIILLIRRWRVVTDFREEAAAGAMTIARAKYWERRYRLIMWSYAAALGAFNFRVAMIGDAAAHLLVVAEIFGFCAGQVTRSAVRPRLCAGTILLAALPTAVGLLTPAFEAPSAREGMIYVAVGLLIAIYAVASLETVRYLYQTMLAQLATKRHLSGLARLDSLTGLPNRLMLRERLDQLLHADDGVPMGALHLIDLDGFKGVNDRYGHPTGDALLKTVGDRLTSILRGGDMAFRLGGDEFAVVQAEIASRDEAEMLGRRIVRCLSEPYALGSGIAIGASCGIALVPEHSVILDELIERADSALYSAKRSGRGTIRFWKPEPELRAVRAA